MFEIEYYKKRDGSEPMKDHLDRLPVKLREKVFRNLLLLEEKGNLLRYPETDDLGGGLYELRTIFGNDIERAFFFFTDGKRIIMTHGYVKKTKKTPPGEIRKANDYRRDYYEQKGS